MVVDGGVVGVYTIVLYNNNSMVANHHPRKKSTPPKFFARPKFLTSTAFSRVNTYMKPFDYFGQHYTEFFAWWPTRMTSGQWVWLDPYFLRPDRNGVGVLLSFEEVRREHE